MLRILRIRNLALLDEVSLEVEAGFTSVTGETGAGKSILLGALRFLAGSRSDKSLIRQGADACEVEAALQFDDTSEIDRILEEMGLAVCEDGTLLLKRVLPRERMARVTVNGSLTTLANLQRLGDLWIDFHGPDDPQKLFQPVYQLELLDLYARSGELLEKYVARYSRWKELLAERERLATAGRLSEDEIEFYRGQIAKIDACGVSEESIEELDRAFNRVSQSQELLENARALAEGLIGDGGVFEKLGALQRLAKEIGEMDPASAAVAERLTALAVEAEDLGRDVEGLADELDFDSAEVERVNERMNLWLELRRRYGGSVESVLETRRELATRLEQQGDIEGTLRRLDREAADAEEEMRQAGEALQKKREAAAADLSKKTAKAIAGLGFQKAVFEVEVLGEKEPTSRGGGCRFLFSPNAGQSPAPLQKIASSGETARVMLALKTILAEVDRTPVLVFDEVDANVGGEVGRIVGRRMAELGRAHQVFCVTHLPQVASLAQSHLVVEKVQENGSTAVTIRPLHEEPAERIREIARMLGDREAKSARAHAEELLAEGGR